jgi:hypothetical protein
LHCRAKDIITSFMGSVLGVDHVRDEPNLLAHGFLAMGEVIFVFSSGFITNKTVGNESLSLP